MTTAKMKAYENLRYRIIIQDLPPGELLKEKELMGHYDIGRTPLREIFIELQREGLIKRVPRSGTWVAPMDMAYVQQVAEVRAALEGLAGELAARRITGDQLGRLKSILDKAEAERTAENKDFQELIQYEAEFHRVVYSATGNKKLEELLLEFLGIGTRVWYHLVFSEDHLFKLFKEQRSMYEALKQGDGKRCRQIMEEHTCAYFEFAKGLRK